MTELLESFELLFIHNYVEIQYLIFWVTESSSYRLLQIRLRLLIPATNPFTREFFTRMGRLDRRDQQQGEPQLRRKIYHLRHFLLRARLFLRPRSPISVPFHTHLYWNHFQLRNFYQYRWFRKLFTYLVGGHLLVLAREWLYGPHIMFFIFLNALFHVSDFMDTIYKVELYCVQSCLQYDIIMELLSINPLLFDQLKQAYYLKSLDLILRKYEYVRFICSCLVSDDSDHQIATSDISSSIYSHLMS